MKTEKITREEANKLSMRPNCRFGVVSDGVTGVWGDGTDEHSAWENAKNYFSANEIDFLRDGEFDLDAIMEDCWIVEVAK